MSINMNSDELQAMPEPTLQDKRLALCEMTTECLSYYQGAAVHPVDCFGGCKGTRKVYLLDPDGKFGLRVKCSDCFGDGKQRQPKVGGMALAGAWYETEPIDEPCPRCQGRGWISTTDLMACARAAWVLADLPDGTCGDTLAARIMIAIQDAFNAKRDPGQAAFDVVWKAMLGEKP